MRGLYSSVLEPTDTHDDINLLMKFIQNNPYRLLGVFSNSPIKERLANNNKLKAFLKVGKDAIFPLDQIEYLPSLHRTEENIASAEAMITLPKDQIKYAQFWFIKQSPLDVVAFNHLLTGEMNKAVAIWEKKDYTSSLQNRMVCALIRSNLEEAINCATILYTSDEHLKEFVTSITGDESNYAIDDLIHTLLDTLCDEYGATQVLSLLKEASWKDYVGQRTIDPLIKNIEAEIEIAKKSRGKGGSVRLNAGRKLANATKQDLQTLKHLLSTDDIRYQMIADKLGLEILQCGIDYYNGAEAKDAAFTAIRIQKYALNIVVGTMAKNRCQENVRILEMIIKNLPPEEVAIECNAIEEELRKYCELPDEIEHAVKLLNSCKPHLLSIRRKLGANNDFYLKISTKVANHALYNLIEEVNEAQKLLSNDEVDEAKALLTILFIRNKVEKAWEATLIIGELDLEADFKNNRYTKNLEALKGLCESLGVATKPKTTPKSSSTPREAPRTTPKSSSTPRTTPKLSSTPKDTPKTTPPSTHREDNTDWNCMSYIIIILIVIYFIIQCNN